jgi:sensor histidine kinase regulating citrate/malate metabolism
MPDDDTWVGLLSVGMGLTTVGVVAGDSLGQVPTYALLVLGLAFAMAALVKSRADAA